MVQQSPDLLPQRLEALRTPVGKSRPVVKNPRTVNPSYQSDQKYIVHKNKNMINKKIKFYHWTSSDGEPILPKWSEMHNTLKQKYI